MTTTQLKSSPNSPTQEPNTPYKGMYPMPRHIYKECLKNHAAAIGGNALDGCGEYIPTSNIHDDKDPFGSLKCAACGCHRNFHRKESEGESLPHHPIGNYFGMKSESEDHGEGLVTASEKAKRKRVRTKFSQEQKEKMARFAERAGWKMVGLDDSLVHHFCQDVGVTRRVLKVWIHNNKHTHVNKENTLML